jgi:hypothetical protein
MFKGCEEWGKLEKKTAVSAIVLLLLLTSMLSSTFIIQPVRASGTIAPTTLHDYDGSWHITDFTINLTATDYTSGTETYYKINDGVTRTVSADGQPLISTEGAANTLEYWSVDNAGNKEDHHVLTGIKLDKTAPIGSIMINDGAASTSSAQVTLTLSAEDATSGVAQMRFFENVWEDWEEYATSKLYEFKQTDWFMYVYVQFRDNAGLVSAPYRATIYLGAPPSSGPPVTRAPLAETPEETPEEPPEKPPETIVPEETAPAPPPTPTPASIADMYLVPGIIGIIIAIAVVGAVIVLMLRKWPSNRRNIRG